MKFLKRRYFESQRYEAEWRDAVAVYAKYYNSIRDALPASATQFHDYEKRRPLHDAAVEAITRPEPNQLIIRFDDRRLEFRGVRDCVYSQPLERSESWLYHEIDVAAGGAFELRAILAFGDLFVVAEEIRLYDLIERRYVIPDQPPPESSQLFFDRKSRHSKRRQ